MSSAQDLTFMARALQLAERGLYTAHPNPRVGCLIVNGGEIVGEGWHERTGEQHAEVHAIERAGARARGATAYVTLEPCSHQGKTPPCSTALITAGIKRVVAAMEDPNPVVAGSGLAQLLHAGVLAEAGLMQESAEALNPGYIRRMREGRPHVRNKLAMSLDGRTAMGSGESHWITGETAREDVHLLRARSSAVMIGSGTVLADDPAMNVRLSAEQLGISGSVRQPLRVVLDPLLSMLPQAKMFSQPGETLILTTHQLAASEGDQLRQAGAEVEGVDGSANNLNLREVLEVLARREINEVLLETGAVLSGAMLQAGLIDEMVLYMAPHLMGNSARGLFHLPGIETMAERIPLQIDEIRAIGKDWRITARPLAASSASDS